MRMKNVIVDVVIASTFLVIAACTDQCDRECHDKTPRPSCFHTQGKGNVYCMDEDMMAHSLTYYKDYDNKRIIEVLSDSSPGPALFVYQNFTNFNKYVMLRDGTCFISPMVDENTHCIPVDAEFIRTIKLEDGHKTKNYRRLESWQFTSHGQFDGRVMDTTGGRRHPYVFRKKDEMVAWWFDNVVDGLEEDDFRYFDVDLSACA